MCSFQNKTLYLEIALIQASSTIISAIPRKQKGTIYRLQIFQAAGKTSLRKRRKSAEFDILGIGYQYLTFRGKLLKIKVSDRPKNFQKC